MHKKCIYLPAPSAPFDVRAERNLWDPTSLSVYWELDGNSYQDYLSVKICAHENGSRTADPVYAKCISSKAIKRVHGHLPEGYNISVNVVDEYLKYDVLVVAHSKGKRSKESQPTTVIFGKRYIFTIF